MLIGLMDLTMAWRKNMRVKFPPNVTIYNFSFRNIYLLSINLILLSILSAFVGCARNIKVNPPPEPNNMVSTNTENSNKLNWFIPDGVRADPKIFTLFKWAREGKLPNIKRMMDEGSYGYSIPTFPSHTPTNFAALLTGTYPKTNGVADGPMRIEGQTLQKPAVAGFSSSARKIPAIWSEFEKEKKIVLLSLPGSTPPEIKQNGITIRGRWGGWGADFNSIIFEKKSVDQRIKLSRNSRLFFLGMELTQFVDPEDNTKWPTSDMNIEELYVPMTVYNTPIHAKLQRMRKNADTNYVAIVFSRDMRTVDATLYKGEWSKWFPINVTWKNQIVKTNIKYHVINIGPGNFFRIRIIIDNLNTSIVDPSYVSEDLKSDIGPMIDFVDNFPPQLVYYPEDKKTFIAESKMSYDWHMNAIDAISDRYKPDVFIHDIYSPNQMLTSKWWMGYIDPDSKRYNDISESERAILTNEVEDMYKQIDRIVGKTLDNSGENTLVVFSSDHGAIPLNTSVKINNLFAKKGWINYAINPNTGEPSIDWINSKVVFLKMSNIYVNPEGLGPVWNRGAGPAYEKLRNEVIKLLEELRDEEGNKPLAIAVKWEDVESTLKIPADRSGDIVIANKPGYGWSEDITKDLKIFTIPLETGYKQAVIASEVKGMWTPFIIVGKGIKKNHMISKPIQHVDQAPIILRAMGKDIPTYMVGTAIDEIFK